MVKRKNNTIIIVIIIAIIATALLCMYFAGKDYFSKHFYRNTTINGYDAGTLTAGETKQLFNNNLTKYTLTIDENNVSEIMTASDIELSYVSLAEIDDCLEQQNTNAWFISMWMNQEITADIKTSYNDDKMQEKLSSLVCWGGETPPQDAYLSYDSSIGEYVIIPEVDGDTYDEEQILLDVTSALSENLSEINVSEYKYSPEVYADNVELNSNLEKLNHVMSASITYKDGYYSFTIDKDAIQSFIVFDGSDITLDGDVIRQYLTDNVCPIFTTLGTTRTLTTPMSGTFEVSGGTYGYDVWRKEEVEQLTEEILNGETVERRPIYYQEGYSWGENDDIGDTYIDVNIGSQMVSLVQNGEITVQTDMVSGNVSTGADTPKGIYQVEFKTTNYTMVKYDTFVNYWMPIDLDTGVGLHDATWRSNFGGNIYQTNGSHGCLNLPYDAAKDIYERIDAGIPVIVH